MSKRNIRKSTGFSFTELLLNVVFLIFLVGVAVPSFSDYLINSEISSLRQSLHSALEDARSDAINLSATVSICPSSVTGKCATEWSSGWISFQDDGRGQKGIANDGVLNGDERVIRSYSGNSHSKISVTEPENYIAVNSISFNALGRPSEDGVELKNPLLIAICDKQNTSDFARGLVLSEKGFASRTRDYDNDGRHESFGLINNGLANNEFDTTDEYNLRCS